MMVKRMINFSKTKTGARKILPSDDRKRGISYDIRKVRSGYGIFKVRK